MLFDKITIIGIGLIGSSLARVIKRDGLCRELVCYDTNSEYNRKAAELGIVDQAVEDLSQAVKDADLIVLSTPVGAYGEITKAIVPYLKKGAIITDVGSVKKFAVAEIEKQVPKDSGIIVVAGHPVAGTEKSGPEAGFDQLFVIVGALLRHLKNQLPKQLKK